MWFFRSSTHLRNVTLALMALTTVLEYFASTNNPFWPKLFGATNEAAFDLWSGQHIMNGVMFAALYAFLRRDETPTVRELVWFVLLCSTIWEVIEACTDLGWAGNVVANWMTGVEHWSNRLLADPGLVVVGALFYRRFPRLLVPMIVGTAIWLTANLCAPNCMYWQECLMRHLP